MGNGKDDHGGNHNPKPPDRTGKKKYPGSTDTSEPTNDAIWGRERDKNNDEEQGVSDSEPTGAPLKSSWAKQIEAAEAAQKTSRQRAESTGSLKKRQRTTSDPSILAHINENITITSENIIRLNEDQTLNYEHLVELVKLQKGLITNLTNIFRSLESRVETRLAPLDNLTQSLSQLDGRIQNLEGLATSQSDQLSAIDQAVSNLANSEITLCNTPGIEQALTDLSTKVTEHTRAACTEQEMLKRVVNAMKSAENSPRRKRACSVTNAQGLGSQDPRPPLTLNGTPQNVAPTNGVPMEVNPPSNDGAHANGRDPGPTIGNLDGPPVIRTQNDQGNQLSLGAKNKNNNLGRRVSFSDPTNSTSNHGNQNQDRRPNQINRGQPRQKSYAAATSSHLPPGLHNDGTRYHHSQNNRGAPGHYPQAQRKTEKTVKDHVFEIDPKNGHVLKKEGYKTVPLKSEKQINRENKRHQKDLEKVLREVILFDIPTRNGREIASPETDTGHILRVMKELEAGGYFIRQGDIVGSVRQWRNTRHPDHIPITITFANEDITSLVLEAAQEIGLIGSRPKRPGDADNGIFGYLRKSLTERERKEIKQRREWRESKAGQAMRIIKKREEDSRMDQHDWAKIRVSDEEYGSEHETGRDVRHDPFVRQLQTANYLIQKARDERENDGAHRPPQVESGNNDSAAPLPRGAEGGTPAHGTSDQRDLNVLASPLTQTNNLNLGNPRISGQPQVPSPPPTATDDLTVIGGDANGNNTPAKRGEETQNKNGD